MKVQLIDQLLDPDEVVENEGLAAAIQEVALHDSRFMPWWTIYRNHHMRPVIIMPYRHLGHPEGTFLWHFHIVRRLDANEKAELLSAMESIVVKALCDNNVEIKNTIPPEDELDLAIAGIVFSVFVPTKEVERREEKRRLWNEVYKRQSALQAQTTALAMLALSNGEPLPACPFCGTRISVERHYPFGDQVTQFTCATPKCFRTSSKSPSGFY